MKWHLALLALFIGLTYANSDRQSSSHLFYIAKSPDAPVKSPRPPTVANKDIYDTYATQATSGVYFKPIDENFGLKLKATTEVSSNGQPHTTSTQATSTYTTQSPYSTSTPFYPSQTSEKPLYQTSTASYESYTSQQTALPSSTIKYPEPYYLKPNDKAPLKMDEPLFYSDYHYESNNLSEKSTTPYYPPSYFQTTASTTVKYDENSVPIYYLAKSYYTSGYQSTTVAPAEKPYTEKDIASYTTTKPYANMHFENTQSYSDLAPSTTKTDGYTTAKPVVNYQSYQTSTPGHYETSAKQNVEYKEEKNVYQTTSKVYNETSYSTTSKPSYEPKEAATPYTTKAQKPRPYKFSYAVKDQPAKNDYSHQQESDGDVVTGSYRVLLPDGRVQIVTYRADKNGYTADVRYEAASPATEHPPSSTQPSTSY